MKFVFLKNKILLSLLGALFCIVIIFFLKNLNSDFEIKINLYSQNTSPIAIDNTIAQNVEDYLLKLDCIKDIYIFSKYENCNIYCKINPFCLNKNKAAEKIQRQLFNSLKDMPDDTIVAIDDEFNKKYDYFVVFSNSDFAKLKNQTDSAFNRLLNKQLANKILKLGEQKRACYINFSYSNLVKFDISVDEIKDLITQNNIFQNAASTNENNNSYMIQAAASIKNIDDIKKIAIYYKNKSFSTLLSDIFEIVEKPDENPNYLVSLDGQKSEVIAISKKKFIPEIFLKKTFENYTDSKIIKTSNYDTISIILDNNSKVSYKNIEDIKNIFEKENIKDALFFIGIDTPKTPNNNLNWKFFEKNKNKIDIFINKKYKNKAAKILNNRNYKIISKKEKLHITQDSNIEFCYKKFEKIIRQNNAKAANFTTFKEISSYFDIDNILLNNYFLNKQEVLNSIMAANEGYFADYYFLGDTKVPIYIKNSDKNNRKFIYLKKFKNLLYIENFLKENIKYDFSSILRKNAKYMVLFYMQN